MLACESRGNECAGPQARQDMTWTFDGTEGTAMLPGGTAGAHLSIEKFDSDAIVVRRTDQSGLTAVYTGKVNGTHISGTVQYSWAGHDGYPASGTFSAELQDQLAAASSPAGTPATAGANMPPELLVCENNGSCNAAWLMQGSEGTGTWFAQNPVHAKLTVVRSEPDYIVVRRTDINDGVAATYAGSLHGDHYAGTIVWSRPGHPGESTGTWTATVPQITCDPNANLEAPDALRIGQNALMFHRDHEALDCYIVAARDGDSTAQTAVGLIFYQGRGSIPQDYTQAFFWLHKAADQGVYGAQRTVAEMYAAGQGTHRDETLSRIYTARADEQKHDLERRQESEERAADRRAQVLSSFVLGASFGAFLFW
jgi:hypothetical protein